MKNKGSLYEKSVRNASIDYQTEQVVVELKRCLADVYGVDARGISLVVDKMRNFLQHQISCKIIKDFILISEGLVFSPVSDIHAVPSSDGVFAAPESHQVLFEDQRIRILWGYLPPDCYVPLHTHSWKSVIINLASSTFKVDFADGTTETEECPVGVYQYPPDEQAIAYTNLGSHYSYIKFEIKG